jgi:hypothetical protein
VWYVDFWTSLAKLAQIFISVRHKNAGKTFAKAVQATIVGQWLQKGQKPDVDRVEKAASEKGEASIFQISSKLRLAVPVETGAMHLSPSPSSP